MSETHLPVEITSIIANFDFRKIEKVMDRLDWTWGKDKKNPTVEEMETHAESLLFQAYKESRAVTIGSGGFYAKNNGQGFLELQFIVEACDSEYSILMM